MPAMLGSIHVHEEDYVVTQGRIINDCAVLGVGVDDRPGMKHPNLGTAGVTFYVNGNFEEQIEKFIDPLIAELANLREALLRKAAER